MKRVGTLLVCAMGALLVTVFAGPPGQQRPEEGSRPTPEMPEPPATTAPPAPPEERRIWGVAAADILGTCPVEVHDRYIVDGEDGWWYRTWHPQEVPIDIENPDAGSCTFAHEHGDDPSTQVNPLVNTPVRFGIIGRNHATFDEPDGHQEPHEGFKVFVGNARQRNENRFHLHDARLVFHMGTGGPRRFGTQFHSMEYRVVTNDGRRMLVQGMADTGGTGSICEPERKGKTVLVLDRSCRLDSLYEIWEAKLTIRDSSGGMVAQAVASTAVFDPITAFDPSQPSRVLYTWDPDVDGILRFPDLDRSAARGCLREAYFGPTSWYNLDGADVYMTDAMGQAMEGGPLRQEISRSGYQPWVATSDGLTQFKSASSHCAPGLGWKN